MFITGTDGRNFNRKGTSEFNLNPLKILTKSNMLNERSYHVFIEPKEGYLMAIGGEYEKTWEVYDIKKDKWIKMALLRNERIRLNVIVSYEKCVFAFGRSKYTNGVDRKFERMQVTNGFKGKWELLKIAKNNDSWAYRYGVGYIQMNKCEYLLFGGYNDSIQSYPTGCKEFNLETLTLMNAQWKLVAEGNFLECTSAIESNGKYYIFSSDGTLHIYNTVSWIAIWKFH